MTAYFTRTSVAFPFFYLSMLYSGCFWQCYRKKKWFGPKSFSTADRAAAVSRRSTPVLERFRLWSRPIIVTRFSSPPPSFLLLEVSLTVTQKPKNQSPEHMDVVAHRALFSPLSAASGASRTAEGKWSLPAQALTCPARCHLTVLNNTHYTRFRPFCSHKLFVETKFSSTGNAACHHYSGLIILYGSPPKIRKKNNATTDRCMSTRNNI